MEQSFKEKHEAGEKNGSITKDNGYLTPK